MAQAAFEIVESLAGDSDFLALCERIAGRFVRPQPRQRAFSYLQGLLLGSRERKNSWQLAEYAGDATSDGMQRLLATYRWDEDGVRDDLRDCLVEYVGDPEAVLVVDETAFLKQGRKSAGVRLQYSKTAGKVDNCQVGLFLAYCSKQGLGFLDRELYLPPSWAGAWERRWEAGVSDGVFFGTRSQLAFVMLWWAVLAGVPFGWVAGWLGTRLTAVICGCASGWRIAASPMCWV